jgi:hypothetical protein
MMEKRAGIIIIAILMPFLLLSCASVDVTVKKVVIHENKQYTSLTDTDQKQELLIKLFRLLKQNKNKEFRLFETDPGSKAVKNEGIRWFVQGGPIPALAKQSSIMFTDVLYIDRENMEIKCKVKSKMTYLYIPIMNPETEAILSIKAPNEIKLTYKLLYSWLIIGTGVFKYEWAIDFIDFDNNVIGAYYAVGGGGPTSVGRGSGYMLVQSKQKTGEKRFMTETVHPKIEKQKKEAIVRSEGREEWPPDLTARLTLSDASENNILDGGEEISLTVDIENRGKGTAQDVQVSLSGSRTLIHYLGQRKFVGDIKPGEKKTVRLATVLPMDIPAETASIKVNLTEGRGFSPSEQQILKIALKPGEVKETIEVISERPYLEYKAYIKDQNNNRVLDGGEEVRLLIEVQNKGDGLAKDVNVILSGSKSLVEYLGEVRVIGDIQKGQKKSIAVKTILPSFVPPETATLTIAIREGSGFSPVERKTFKIAMRPTEVKETIEVISEVNVDEIPPKTKDFKRKNDYAFIIGIGKYRESIIPSIKYSERDAEIVAKYLEHIGGIPRQNIKLLTGENATKSDLVAYSKEWLERRATSNSRIFIYYAGHGAPDPQSREAYIVPYEGHPDFPSKLYPLKELYETLGQLPAREIIVMLDSCFSGAQGRSVTSKGARPISISIENPVLASKNITVIAGSTGNQISSDYDKVEHGLFTYYLLRGMRGDADTDMNGKIELGELYHYVRSNVSERASLELNRDQTPVILPPVDNAKDKLKIVVTRYR